MGWATREKAREWLREYRKRPDVKMRLAAEAKIYGQSPKRKKYTTEYNKRPDVMAHRSIISKGKYVTKRQYLIDAKSDGCVKCGEKRIPCLTFHHVNPKDKAFNLGSASGISIERIKDEIAKCIILCANCHAMTHWTGK